MKIVWPTAFRWLHFLPLASSLCLVGMGGRAVLRRIQGHASAPAPYRDRFAVATENAMATRVGIEALRSGANAVDAAISVAFTLGVVQPSSSGIGGGGFALVWEIGRASCKERG